MMNTMNGSAGVVILVLLASAALVWVGGDIAYSRVLDRRLRQWEADVERDESGVRLGCGEYTVGHGDMNLSTKPTAMWTLFFSAALIRPSASATVLVIGFSTRTCFPASMAAIAISAWVTVGVQMETASTSFLSGLISIREES